MVATGEMSCGTITAFPSLGLRKRPVAFTRNPPRQPSLAAMWARVGGQTIPTRAKFDRLDMGHWSSAEHPRRQGLDLAACPYLFGAGSC